jgi:hypothetical protein
MKSFFKVTMGVLALTVVQQASAVEIRLTGSTAFRSGTHKAIVAMMGGETSCKFAHGMITGAVTAATAAAYEAADYTTIQGTISGVDGTSTVYCSWTGSATGIADVSAANNINFVPASALPANTGYANAAVTQAATESAAAMIAFSDVYASSTPTPDADLTDNIVAVIPFSWIANRGTTGLTSMTQQQARAVLSKPQPKYLWTGNAADTGLVFAVGRDTGSGTRITCLAETKYGISQPTQHFQLTSTGTSGSGSITVAQLWPIGSGVGSTSAGNGGYSSGSTLRTFFGMNSTATQRKNGTGVNVGSPSAYTFVSWVGISDANTMVDGNTSGVPNAAVRLAYEGVTYTGATADEKAKIYNGLYTAWGYLHAYTLPSTTTDEQTFMDNLKTQLDDEGVLGTSGLRNSQMVVARQSDGAVVGP